MANGEFLSEPTLIAKLLEGSTYRSDRHRIQCLNLVGAIVETALDSADGVNIDLRQSASLHFSRDPMPARFGRHGLWASFRTSGTGPTTKLVSIDVAGIVHRRKTYAISSRYIRIRDRFFEVFYNDDDIVLLRVTGGSFKKLLNTHKIPTPSLSHAWGEQEGSKVRLNVELERGLADKVALHAAEAGLAARSTSYWSVLSMRRAARSSRRTNVRSKNWKSRRRCSPIISLGRALNAGALAKLIEPPSTSSQTLLNYGIHRTSKTVARC